MFMFALELGTTFFGTLALSCTVNYACVKYRRRIDKG